MGWAVLLRQPQTYLLLVGIGLGFALLVGLAGWRPWVWIGGGTIAAIMLFTWMTGFRSTPSVLVAGDLLNGQVLQQELDTLAQKVPQPRQKPWPQVRTWAEDAQRFAERICDRDPLMRADLLEALHTVLDLARQVAEALQVLDHIETPAYQALAQKRLRASCDRMAATHAQLQQLQDQVALSALDSGQSADKALPQRLQTLVAANRQILNDIDSESKG
ncbi:hypothetical protein C7271_08190 [filamentous cyanobacterium CCP5]|nr:hypothetical protein C7293_31610 [filamentous cyanobacterium CCT1]PSN19274.1 hypothetical protein C7271_08190 [filamentous cyanobacterium CCP5]